MIAKPRETAAGTEYWDNKGMRIRFVPKGEEPDFEVTEAFTKDKKELYEEEMFLKVGIHKECFRQSKKFFLIVKRNGHAADIYDYLCEQFEDCLFS